MASHNDLGAKGENLAANYLHANGYEVLKRNYRYGRAEVDIVVRKDGILIFVEVKTRSSSQWGDPEDFVSPKKVELFLDAAFHFMQEMEYEGEIRFDILSIIISKHSGVEIKHLKDAFVP